MQRLFNTLLTTAIVWQASSLLAQAQLVQVSPGYVRAPFVRVYSYPGGGSYVRAPFVGVYSPGFHRGYVTYNVPTQAQYSQMDYRSLNQAIRDARAQLDADLSHFSSADFWKSSLKTAEIGTLVPSDSDAPPAEDVRQRLAEIDKVYDALGNDPQSNRIAGLTSFQVLRAALGEYSAPPEQRMRQRMAAAARNLQQALGQFATGPGWQKYLMVGPGMALAPERWNENESPPAAELSEALHRFDEVSRNADFAVINSLPAFKTMFERLGASLEHSQSPGPREELPTPAAEQPGPSN